MDCRFRFVEALDPTSVGLRLFFDDGLPKGEVLGPLAKAPDNRVDRCVADPDAAFMAAIRIANTHDAEVVVTGDMRLWRPDWGRLLPEVD